MKKDVIIFCSTLLVLMACGGGRMGKPARSYVAPPPAQDYTRDVYQPFATDNVIPHYPADNDEEFFPFYYYDD